MPTPETFKKTYLSLLFISVMTIAASLSAIAVASGFVPVKNYPRDIYLAGNQNWAFAQDSLGRAYFANRDGLLRFDGQRWKRFFLSNYTTVRSLLYDETRNRIYAGGSEEIGYFSPDSLGVNLTYTSLNDKFRNDRPGYSEVWNIFRSGEKIYFQTDFRLFCFDGNDVVDYPAPGRISRSAIINEHIILALDDGTLVRFTDSGFVPLEGTQTLKGKKIMGLLPFTDKSKIIIATSDEGLFTYDGGSVEPLETDISQFLRANQVFSATCNYRGDYIFGTVNRGAVIKNFINGSSKYINKESGLQNNTVLGSGFDRAGNVWLCLDNGLAYALCNSPVTNLTGTNNDIGAGYASMRRGNLIYFGTNQGLYSSNFPFPSSPSPIDLHRELKGQIWSLTQDDMTIFVSGDAGAFHSEGTGFRKINGLPGTYMIKPLNDNPGLALASTYERFHLLQREGSGWTDLGSVEGYDDIGGSFLQDSDGYIWLAHWRKGIYRLHLNPASRRFDQCLMIDTAAGLPYTHNNSVAIVHDEIIFSTVGGFYTFDNKSRQMTVNDRMNAIFPGPKFGPVTTLPDGSMIMTENTGLDIARPGADGHPILDNRTFKSLGDKLMPGFVNIYYADHNELIVSNQDGFWSIDIENVTPPSWMPEPFVSNIYADHDSLVYQASPDGKDPRPLQLPYNLNTLRMEFAYPDFSIGNKIEFSSFLENYDTEWSPFSTESSREYTRLDEGKYVMHLRARNPQTGETKEFSFPLRITPPWYRSATARIIYFLLILLMAGALYRGVILWMRKTRRRLDERNAREMAELRQRSEQEALKQDYEIATLKSEQLEQDIRHRSQELRSTTMNLVRKNEILQEIAAKIDKIQAQAENTAESAQLKKQLSKIRTSIAENIRKDDDWSTINQNFDIVYENYTRRLMELHPGLSASDKRMCCYIKMGLSSKEIAPLVNISYKSVEMARYRLRKKMNIPMETSLYDYLAAL